MGAIEGKRERVSDRDGGRGIAVPLLILSVILIVSSFSWRQRVASAQEPAETLKLVEIHEAGNGLAGVAGDLATGGLVLAYLPGAGRAGRLGLMRPGVAGSATLAEAGIIDGSLLSIPKDTGRFRRGEIYFGLGAAGQIARTTPEMGRKYEILLTLPGEDGVVTSLAVDETNVFGGELIAATSRGNVWRIDGFGTSRLIASLGREVAIDSVIVAGGDTTGPLTGRILALSRRLGRIYEIDADGQVTVRDFGIPRPAALLNIGSGGNLYAVVSAGARTLRGLSMRYLVQYFGGILIAQAAGEDSPMALYAVNWRGDGFRIERLAEAADRQSWIQLAVSGFNSVELQQQNAVVPFIGPFGNPEATGPTDDNDDFTLQELIVPKDNGHSTEASSTRFIVTLKNTGAVAGNISLSAPGIPGGFDVRISPDSGATFLPLTAGIPITLPNPVDPDEERNIDVRITVPAGTPVNLNYDLILRAASEANPPAANQTICRIRLIPPMPNLLLEKKAVDLDGGLLHPGDLIEYCLILSNFSPFPVARSFVVDYLPQQVDYLENSVRIVSGANSGSKTDTADDDQVDYLPQAGANGQINIATGTGAGGHANGFLNGGVLAPGESTTIVFQAMVREGICCGTVIINGAEWGGDGVYPGGKSNVVQNIVRIANPLIGPFGDPGATGATGINDDMTVARVNLDVSSGMTTVAGSLRYINTIENSGTAAGRFIIRAPVIPAGFVVRASVDSGATFIRLNDNGSIMTASPLDPREFRNLDVRVDYPVGLIINQPYDIVLEADHEDDATRTNQTINRLVVDPNPPDLALRKGVRDLSGKDVDGKAVYQGQTLEYSLTLTNQSNLRVTRTIVNDFLPEGITFVPGSVRIVSGPNAGDKTDTVGDDQADFFPNEGVNGHLTIYTGSDAAANAGGALEPGQSTTVVFRVMVERDGLQGSVIRNFGEWGAEEFFTGGRSNVVETTVGGLCRTTAILEQPGPQAVCAGQASTFRVAADGSDLSYQWRFNGQPIQGATGDTLMIPRVSAANVGMYDVVVTGACGVVSSEPAELRIVAPPAITRQPEGSIVLAGQDGVLSVAASGVDLKYQWRRNGVEIPGGASMTLTIPRARPTDSGDYDVVVTGMCGMQVSAIARLNVYCQPTVIGVTVLPEGYVGVPYKQTVSIPGTNPQITQPGIPRGLTFDLASGILSGTPLEEGSYSFTLTWEDERGCIFGTQVELEITRKAAPECSTICFRSALYYSINFGTSAIPDGTVIVAGVNNGAGISSRDPRVRLALTGAFGAMNREYVAAQLSILRYGGMDGAAMITASVSAVSCYGISFDETIVQGKPVSPAISLFDLIQLAAEVARTDGISQTHDSCVIANILHALNGDSPIGECHRTGGPIVFTGCN